MGASGLSFKSCLNMNEYEFYDKIPRNIIKLFNKPLNIKMNLPIYKEYTILRNPVEKNDEIYYGHWNFKNQKSGFGKMIKKINNKETIYINGKWENGELKYAIIFEKNGVYEGEIKNYLYCGKGKFTYADTKNIYEGFFIDGEIFGSGILKYPDGCIYSGQLIDNKKEGEGFFIWSNGYYYKGNFKNDIFNGRGILKKGGEKLYEGGFKNGFFMGKGKFTWVYPNNEQECYDGEYLYGKKHGYGEFKFKNGNTYKGMWFDNKANGEGSFETKNKIYKCNYQYGIVLNIIDVYSKTNEDEEKIDLDIDTPKEGLYIDRLPHLNYEEFKLNDDKEFSLVLFDALPTGV